VSKNNVDDPTRTRNVAHPNHSTDSVIDVFTGP